MQACTNNGIVLVFTRYKTMKNTIIKAMFGGVLAIAMVSNAHAWSRNSTVQGVRGSGNVSAHGS